MPEGRQPRGVTPRWRYGGVAGAVGLLDGVEGLGQGADLVDLDEHGVRGAHLDALLDALGVGDEQVVADELDAAAQALGQADPTVPVVLAQAVLDGD